MSFINTKKQVFVPSNETKSHHSHHVIVNVSKDDIEYDLESQTFYKIDNIENDSNLMNKFIGYVKSKIPKFEENCKECYHKEHFILPTCKCSKCDSIYAKFS